MNRFTKTRHPGGKSRQLTCIDLFCGCGGFTLGMQRAGFHVLAAIDFNAQAVATLRANLVERRHPKLMPVGHALERDLTTFHPKELAAVIGVREVDVIVGGPPCQGFSMARQVDGSNHGARIKEDPRRQLYREFLRYVDFFQPRVFVMENVLGIRSAAGGIYFTQVQKEARALGYRVHAQIENAWDLGVPQKRRRQLIIGVSNKLPGYFLPELKPAPRARPHTCLGAAVMDLPSLRAGEGSDETHYDLVRRCRHIAGQDGSALDYLSNVAEIDRSEKLTNHVSRPHSERDLRDFELLREGENSATAMRDRGVEFQFPYDKSSFKDRYTRQSRRQPCSTIVAHLSKDGLMFIHPTQNRSLTPREAARIQSFPDWFRFPSARTHSFRLIGNAVPPLIGEAVGLEVREFLKMSEGAAAYVYGESRRGAARRAVADTMSRRIFGQTVQSGHFPLSRPEAAKELEKLAKLDRRTLRTLPVDEFLRGWHALLFLFPGLHPDNALDHGNAVEEVTTEQIGLPGFERMLDRRHIRSGWPVALELIGREALLRHEWNEINNEQLYCVEAQRAGLCTQIKGSQEIAGSPAATPRDKVGERRLRSHRSLSCD